MGAPRAPLNPATNSVGFTAKLVTVTSVSADGKTAIVTDRQNVQNQVSMLVQRSKGPLPAQGEAWLITQDLGAWNFAAFVATSAADFQSGSAGGGTEVTVGAEAPLNPARGDLWLNSAAGNAIFTWSGTIWTAVQLGTSAFAPQSVATGTIALGAVGSAQIAPNAGIKASQVAFRAGDIGGSRIFTLNYAPTGMVAGDLWFNPALANTVSVWNGNQWIPLLFGAPAIAPGSLTGNQLAPAAGISASQVNFTASQIGGITTSITAVQPSGPSVGDLWYDASNGYQLKQWNGVQWAQYKWGTQSIAARAVTAQLIAANTITAAQIAAGTITAGQIAAGTITAAQIAAGTITAAQIAAGTITAAQIAAGTITAAQIQAGTVVAGIIDGTTVNAATVNGSTFNGTDWTSNALGSFYYSAAPASGDLSASITPVGGTDGFGNVYAQGVNAYAVVSGSTYAIGLNQVNNAGLPGFSIQNPSAPAYSPPGVFGLGSGGHARAFFSSGSRTNLDAAAFVEVSSSLDSAIAGGSIYLSGGQVGIGGGGALYWDDNNEQFVFQSVLTTPPGVGGSATLFASPNGNLESVNGNGNNTKLGIIYSNTRVNAVVNSTSYTALKSVSVVAGVLYNSRLVLVYTGNQAAGLPEFSFGHGGVGGSITDAVGATTVDGVNVGVWLNTSMSDRAGPTLDVNGHIMVWEMTFTAPSSGNLTFSVAASVAADTWNAKALDWYVRPLA